MNFLKHLKLFLFSHKDNNHTPIILTEVFLIAVLLSGIFLLGVSYGRHVFLHKTVLGESVESNVLIDLTNEARIKYNQIPLIKNDNLENAAYLKGQDMIKNSYFAHNSPSGVTPWYFIKKAGYNFIYAGENLAMDFTESGDIENAWLNSPAHRDNILNKNFREIGISTQIGNFNGHNTIFVVQMFGTQKNYLNSEKLNNGKVLGVATTSYEELDYKKYSDKTDNFIFFFWYRLNIIYRLIVLTIIFSILSLFFVELKKHHWKHILYGVITIILILLMFSINYYYW